MNLDFSLLWTIRVTIYLFFCSTSDLTLGSKRYLQKILTSFLVMLKLISLDPPWTKDLKQFMGKFVHEHFLVFEKAFFHLGLKCAYHCSNPCPKIWIKDLYPICSISLNWTRRILAGEITPELGSIAFGVSSTFNIRFCLGFSGEFSIWLFNFLFSGLKLGLSWYFTGLERNLVLFKSKIDRA